MLIAASLLSVVMVGVGSAVLVASHAVPGGSYAPAGGGAAAPAGESCDAAALIASELAYARQVTELSPTAVTFTVPDRDGDGAEETIRYAWDGTPGSSLRRTFNGTTAVLAGDVRSFALSYDRETVSTEQTVTATQTSPEMLLASFNGWATVNANVYELGCTQQTWCATYFKASGLPSSAKRLTVTRAKLLTRRDLLSADTFSVCVQKAVGNGNPKPSNIRIGNVTTVASLSLLGSGYGWVDVPLSGVTTSNVAQEMCLVVRGDLTSTLTGVYLQYHNKTNAPADGTFFSWTTTAGSGWNPSSSKIHDYDMPFYAYGTYESDETQTVTVTRHYLRGVGVNLSAGPDGSPRAHTSVRVLNRPEVAAP